MKAAQIQTLEKKQFDTWENSLEGIHDNLKLLEVAPHIEVKIVGVLAQLPKNVREFVYKECAFISIGDSNAGTTFCMEQRNLKNFKWLIVLCDGAVNNDISIIAHEIAHATLGHKKFDSHVRKQAKKVETDAARLTKKWGFIGLGSDEKHCCAHLIGSLK